MSNITYYPKTDATFSENLEEVFGEGVRIKDVRYR